MYNEKGSSEVTFMLVLVVVVVVGFLAYALIDISIKNSEFYTRYNEGDIQINANFIELSLSGSPAISNLPEWVPSGTELEDRPKEFWIEDCEGIDLPKGISGVYAATSFEYPEMVVINLPPNASGVMNVCVPEGIRVKVVLWAK